MLFKNISTLFVLLHFANFTFAQKFSFTVEANSNYSFLSADFIEPEPLPSSVGFTHFSFTTPSLLKMNQDGKVGSGISGKFGAAFTERLTYRVGVGVVMRRNTFSLKQFDIALNGFTSNGFEGVNIYGTEYIDTLNLVQYYSTNINSSVSNNEFTNTFWQFTLIPLELDYQLIKNKLNIYGNVAFQPVFSVGGTWGHRAALDAKNDVFNDLQMGAEMGFQYQIFPSWSVQASYFRGLTDVYKDTRYRTRWNSVSLGIVYRIK